jgi:hypothetical protein
MFGDSSFWSWVFHVIEWGGALYLVAPCRMCLHSLRMALTWLCLLCHKWVMLVLLLQKDHAMLMSICVVVYAGLSRGPFRTDGRTVKRWPRRCSWLGRTVASFFKLPGIKQCASVRTSSPPSPLPPSPLPPSLPPRSLPPSPLPPSLPCGRNLQSARTNF